MGQGQQKRRAVLIVEDDAELRHLTAALFEDEKLEPAAAPAPASPWPRTTDHRRRAG
jgi:CheY-like chemotaxis protein